MILGSEMIFGMVWLTNSMAPKYPILKSVYSPSGFSPMGCWTEIYVSVVNNVFANMSW